MKFTQEEFTAPNATNFSGRSQGLPANRAGELIAEGLGQAATGFAAAKDFKIQQDIRQDVEDTFFGQNHSFGLTEETGFSGVKVKDEDGKRLVPDEFKDQATDFENRLSNMEEARKQGALTDTHYYSMLSVSMKNLKSKYPGYHEVIDNIYKEVTGVNPANAVANSIRNDLEERERISAAGQSDVEKKLWDTAEYWHDKYPDYLTNKAKYAGRENEILQYAQQKMAREQSTQAALAEANMAQKTGELTKERAQSTFTTEMNNITQSVMDTMIYPEGNDVTAQIMEIAKNGKVDPVVLETIINRVNTAEMELRQRWTELAANPAFSSLSPEQIKSQQEGQLANLNYIRKMLQNEEYGLAGMAARRMAVTNQNRSEALSRTPAIAAVQAATEINPALGQLVVNGLGGERALANDVLAKTTQLINEAVYGVTGMGEIMSIVDKEDVTPEVKSQIGTMVINNVQRVFADPAMTDSELTKFVKQNFLGDNPDMTRVINKVSAADNGKLKVYQKLTSPMITDRLAAIQDGGLSAKAYASWVYSTFMELPEVGIVLSNMSEVTNPDVGMPQFKIFLDEKTNRFVAAPNPEYMAAQGPFAKDNVMIGALIKEAQKDLDKVNLAFGNLSYALDKSGVDKQTYLKAMFKMKGINIEESTISGGSSTGTNPLDQGTGLGALSNFLPDNFAGTGAVNQFINFSNNVANDSLDGVEFNWTEEALQGAMATGDYKSLLDTIAKGEAPLGYNQVYGKNRFLPRENMTLDEVLGWQAEEIARGTKSSAVGRYQFLRKTLAGLKTELGLKGTEVFTPELQDRLASALVERRGGKDYKAGKLSREQFLKNLSMEWASLPKDSSGLSYYAGDGLNAAHIGHDDAMAAIDSLVAQSPSSTDWEALGYGNIPEAEREDFLKWNPNPIADSEKNLGTVRPEMQEVVKRAQEISGRKFVIGSAKRDMEQQKKAVELGWSKSFTNYSPHVVGDAVDVWALDDNGQITFDDEYYVELNRSMMQAAEELGYEVDWGGNWKRFKDIPHFQFKGKRSTEVASK